MCELETKIKSSWSLPDNKKQWTKNNWKHLQAVLRLISQARGKSMPWVDIFNPEVAIGPLDRIVAAQRPEQPQPHPIDDGDESDPDYLVGYSMEHEAAWRVIEKGGRPVHKDYCQDIKLVPTDDGEEVCEATWPDGFKKVINALPAEVFRRLKDPAAAQVRIQKKPAALLMKKPSSEPTTDMQTKDSQSIKIKRKKDRHEIYQLEVGGKPKCQIRKDIAEGSGAYDIMETIATELSKGNVDINGLYEMRNQLIEKKGLVPPAPARTPPRRRRRPSPRTPRTT